MLPFITIMAEGNICGDDRFDFYPPSDELRLKAPIVGFEVVEARKRFTVYKINVQLGEERSWFVFRRYSDFVRLDQELKRLISTFTFPLPPKKYFGDNFDNIFLETRRANLQEYIQNVLVRDDTCTSQPAAEFFCFDDPPGPYDSLQESRAFIEVLEDTVSELKQKHNDLTGELRMIRSQLRQSQAQKQALLVALRAERVLNGKPSCDNDDIALMSEYSGLPEVCQMDLNRFSREGDELTRSSQFRRTALGRFPTSTAASQLDLRFVSERERSSSLRGRRVRSTSDLSTQRRRNTSHLPSNDNSGLLDRFLRQSTEALQQIRITVREKLGEMHTEAETDVES